MNKFIKSMWQLFISTSNATLKILSLPKTPMTKTPFSLLLLLSFSFQINLSIVILSEKTTVLKLSKPFCFNFTFSQNADKFFEKYLCGGKFK